ncbi:sugar ABC transporter ATP-binding protein [Georgenia halophila]|uniref:Sugar ABC transporter ATP-binding protein n=1 Tax=Georgenia halophila TaxID=620889 RepID=A0ABP8KXF6_9MICO
MTTRMDAGGDPPLVRMRGVTKIFTGTRVLSDVDVDLRRGEIHALMGENGAGKSTLMKILGGVHQRDAGVIEVDGQQVSFASPGQAIAAGVAMIHQELSTVPEMSVAENLALGAEPARAGFVLDRRRLRSEAARKLEPIGGGIDPDTRMRRLSVGRQQMVEIARAIDQRARVLILDEPTASLSDTEAQRLFEVLERMRADGMGLFYISHRLDEVSRLADRITVLRDGVHVSTTARGEISQGEVVNHMIGRQVDALYVREHRRPGDAVLQVRDVVGRQNGVGPVSFDVRAGEVVSLVGLIGAGRTEIARAIYGADPLVSGSITIDGEPVRLAGPSDAIASRIGMVPESRKEQALFAWMDVRDNITVASLRQHSRWGVLNLGRVDAAARKFIDDLSIRVRSPRQEVRTLSGGNQQKVVLARWLANDPRLLILDEPTRGVDVGAKHEIYRIINEQAERGTAVLIVSSDLPEALGISDRLLVVRDGQVVKELDGARATEEDVMSYATGMKEAS